MLSKKICMECIKTKYFQWSQYDEDRWTFGIIWCFDSNCQVNIVNIPPIGCPYELDHMVLRQDVK